MTVEELSRLPRLREEIKRDRERLYDLRTAADSIPSPNLSGMPKAPGFSAGSRIEKYAALIIDLERDIERKEREAIRCEKAIWQFISESRTEDINAIIIYRFIYGMPWKKVAESLSSGKTDFTDTGVKTRFNRFMEKHPDGR